MHDDDDERMPASGFDFGALFYEGPSGYVVTSKEGAILEANDAFLRWTGFRRAEIVGTDFLRMLPIGDRILYSTRALPLLDMSGRATDIAVSLLDGRGERRRALLTSSRVLLHDPLDHAVTTEVYATAIVPARDPSFEEQQLISAVHRAEESNERRQRAEGDLRQLRTLDPLTNLLNRTGLLEALAGRLAQNRPESQTWVYIVDLDHFRVVNESLGHGPADDILRAVAHRLETNVGEGALLGRLSGDEYAVVLDEVPGAGSSSAAAARAESLLDLIFRPIAVDDLELVMSASLGAAAADEAATPTALSSRDAAQRLIRNAGTAMYEAKAAGRHEWRLYAEAPDETAINEIRLLGEIRAGLEHDEFHLLYQPQIKTASGRLHGVEALIRWQHPARGAVSPAGFIEVAERSGLIRQLGAWVVGTAIAQLGRWQVDAPDKADTRWSLSLNVSAGQLLDPTLVDTVSTALRASSVDAARITLEITETVFLSTSPQTVETLLGLKALGVKLAVDDFGTGHAGFSYLKDIPADELKIDRSFVTGLGVAAEDTAIITSCIQLGHAIGARVVAEGVETEAQLATLARLGCDIAQGYYVARPLTPAQFDEWRSEWAETAPSE